MVIALDAGPLIEPAISWSGILPAEPHSPDVLTVLAWQGEAGESKFQEHGADGSQGLPVDRAASRAEAMMFDLWVGPGANAASHRAERLPIGETSLIHMFLNQTADLQFEHVTKFSLFAANAAKPQPGNYVDSNGNGQWDEGEEILVKGTRPKTTDDDSAVWDPPLAGSGGGGSDGGPSLPSQPEHAKDTPCVHQVPAGVDLHQLNDAAKVAGTQLGGLQDNTHWEWGVLIYRDANGQIHQSDPFTAQHQDDLVGATAHIPDGAIVIGYVHSHPIDINADQRVLSSVDRDFIKGLIDSGRADPNMLAYITTKDEDSDLYLDEYKTYVYDSAKRNATSPGCDL